MKYADKSVHRPSDIPSVEHWAIITGSSLTIPGDERSRTNPGHGYPESTENYINYDVYLNEADFKVALEKELQSPYSTNICGIHVLEKFVKKVTVEAVKA
jgi:hypothetical protein